MTADLIVALTLGGTMAWWAVRHVYNKLSDRLRLIDFEHACRVTGADKRLAAAMEIFARAGWGTAEDLVRGLREWSRRVRKGE